MLEMLSIVPMLISSSSAAGRKGEGCQLKLLLTQLKLLERMGLVATTNEPEATAFLFGNWQLDSITFNGTPGTLVSSKINGEEGETKWRSSVRRSIRLLAVVVVVAPPLAIECAMLVWRFGQE
jgi:hypothetical protein